MASHVSDVLDLWFEIVSVAVNKQFCEPRMGDRLQSRCPYRSKAILNPLLDRLGYPFYPVVREAVELKHVNRQVREEDTARLPRSKLLGDHCPDRRVSLRALECLIEFLKGVRHVRVRRSKVASPRWRSVACHPHRCQLLLFPLKACPP